MFVPAQKKEARLRMAIAGPSGSGKTYSSLLIASGLAPWHKVGVIDTERGSSNLYADLGPYLVHELIPPYTPAKYIQTIKEAEAAGIEVLIIDSLSHAWAGEGGILDMHSQAADKIKNSFSAWREVSPLHNRLVDTMLQSKCHIIATLRTKTEYVVEEGGKKVRKVGVAPIQRDGLEYEFTIYGELSLSHLLTISKDRTGLFQDQSFLPDASIGQQLKKYFAGIKEKPEKPESGLASVKPTAVEKPAAPEKRPADGPELPEEIPEPPIEEPFFPEAGLPEEVAADAAPGGIPEEAEIAAEEIDTTVLVLDKPEGEYIPTIDTLTDEELLLHITEQSLKEQIESNAIYHIQGVKTGDRVEVTSLEPVKGKKPELFDSVLAATGPVQRKVQTKEGRAFDTLVIKGTWYGQDMFFMGAALKDVQKGHVYNFQVIDSHEVVSKDGTTSVAYLVESIEEAKTAA